MINWLIVIFGSLYIILAVAAMTFIIRRGLILYLRQKRLDKISISAKVKCKVDQQGFHGVSWKIGSIRQVIVFECEDGIDRTFDVSEAIWNITEEGDKGTLTFQGTHAIEFCCHHHKRHLDDAYARLTRR